jgi:hypothetical protein
MVLNNGKTNVEQLLAGNVSGKKITKLCVGTSNTPATAADTTITGGYEKDVTSVEYLPGNIVKFVAELDAGDAAIGIWELGLKNEDGVLVHRKVFDTVQTKVSGLAFRITYSIKVS